VDFELVETVKSKPVIGPDDLLLLLTHLWARDTCTFPTEDQRESLAAIMLMSIFTSCRPAELVERAQHKATCKYKQGIQGDSNSEEQDLKGDLDNPNYDALDPWDNPNNADYNVLEESATCKDNTDNLREPMKRCKALCYEDIRLWIVQNPLRGERDLLAMEVTLVHHKGADKKPKPYVTIPYTSIIELTSFKALPSSSAKRSSLFFVLSATF
jgi:hypothetical protein